MSTIVVSHALYKDGMEVLKDNELIIPNNGDSDVILEDLKKADGYILRIGKIDRKAIEQCPNLKVITRPGVGYDSVDVKAATEYGIPVALCPSTNAGAVAEHTVALLLSIAKNIVRYNNETENGNYAVRNTFTAVNVEGKTVSILGFGHIGRKVAEYCTGLGMKIVAYDPFVKPEDVKALGYTPSSDLHEALSLGDFVTIHMPSMDSTRGMIGKDEFAAMKDGAYFINCARGDIVNENELYNALVNGKLAGAAADVLEKDPPENDNPLFKLNNFIITPHSAAQTKETASALAIMAANATLTVLRGEKWPHVANPEVYEHPRWKGK